MPFNTRGFSYSLSSVTLSLRPVTRNMASRANLKPPDSIDVIRDAAGWKKWKQRFELYLAASGLDKEPDIQKVSLLLHCIGETGLDVATAQQIDVNTTTYKDAIEKLDKFVEPNKNVVFSRYKFFSRTQQEHESVDCFVTNLRVLAESCDFGEQKDSLL